MPSPSSASEAERAGAENDSADPAEDQAGAAGKKLAEVGKALSSAAGNSVGSENGDSAGDDAQAGSSAPSEPWDPLLPEPLENTNSDGERFDESLAEASDDTGSQSSDTAPSGDQAASSNSAQTASSDERAEREQTSSTAQIGNDDPAAETTNIDADDLGADLQALAEALARAGITLTNAGELLSQSATSGTSGDAGSDALDSALSEASIAILILEQQLNQLETNGVDGERVSDAARLVILANEALSDATLATDSRAPLPTLSGRATQTAGDQRIAELDAELERSIVVFETDIQDARNAVAAELAGSATEAAGGPSMVDLAEGLAQADPAIPLNEADAAQGEATARTAAPPRGRAPGRTQQQSAGPAPIPEDIPSPQGDDIVAKQLREAAAAEQDPALREKLWDEYKRYKQGL
jgi:hypothetical protein